MLIAKRQEGAAGPGPALRTEWSRDGEWSGWRADARSLAFRLAPSDPSPLFFAECGETLALSVNLLELLEHVPDLELDLEAISTFLYLGFFVGDRTPFRRIRALRPGESATFDAGGLRREPAPDPAPPECRMGLADVTDALVHAVRGAVAASAPAQPFVHPLSGGRDSRFLLLELTRQGHVPRECLTLADTPEHPDAAVARTVCAALGIPHRVLPPAGQGFDHELVNADATHLCADEHSWLVPLAAELCRITPVVFDGLGGGTLLRGSFAGPPGSGRDESALAAALVERFRPPSAEVLELAGALLGGRLLSRPDVEERIAEALRGLADEPNPMPRFIFRNRTWREVALVPRSMYRGIPSVHTPFLHPAVVALVRSLPAGFFGEHPGFQDHVIRAAYPHAADLPYVEKSAVYPARRRRVSGVLSRLRRNLWWRRHLDASDRALVRQLAPIMKANRFTWLVMLKILLGSRSARLEVTSRAERVLGRVAYAPAAVGAQHIAREAS